MDKGDTQKVIQKYSRNSPRTNFKISVDENERKWKKAMEHKGLTNKLNPLSVFRVIKLFTSLHNYAIIEFEFCDTQRRQ